LASQSAFFSRFNVGEVEMKIPLIATMASLALCGCSMSGSDSGGAVPSSSGGLINVNLSDIRAEIAKNVDLALEDVPITIQLPVTVAANVCGVDVSLLSAQLNTGSNSCTAVTTSPTLEQTVTNTTG
jgi:hypothetical protein